MFSKVPNSVLVAILNHLKLKVMDMQLPALDEVGVCRMVTFILSLLKDVQRP